MTHNLSDKPIEAWTLAELAGRLWDVALQYKTNEDDVFHFEHEARYDLAVPTRRNMQASRTEADTLFAEFQRRDREVAA